MTDDRSEDASYENEGRKVTIPLKESDILRSRHTYLTYKSFISVIYKIDELVRALRKHIVRSDFD